MIDSIYEETEEHKIDDLIFNIIEESSKLYEIKDNWKDRWNFNNWAKTYDIAIKEDKGALKIYKNYETILQDVYHISSQVDVLNPTILEIGVGTGNLASKFLENNFNIIGIDQSKEMLLVAKEKYPKLKVRIGEFLKIPFSDNHFDIIVSTYAFHHLNKNEKVVAIEEMARVLKSNGIIVIGDLMFKNEDEEKIIIEKLSLEEKMEVQDEYYSHIDFLQREFKKHGKKLKYIKIDKFNYIIKVDNIS